MTEEIRYSALHYAAKSKSSADAAAASASHCDQVAADFDVNAAQKTSDFDANAAAKTTTFNNNAQTKTNEYNANHNDKLAIIQGKVTESQTWATRSENAAHTTLRDVVPLGSLTTDSTTTLAENNVYSATIPAAGNYSFALSITNTSPAYHVQIKLFLTVVPSAPIISWGCDKFFNGAEPDIDAGNYVIYWDYDNLTQQWVCGGMPYSVAD